MPAPIAAKAGVIAVSVAVAVAIAIYESPELQNMASDLRRRIAIALHAFGDSISPQERENILNRPEDAEGFLRSRGLATGHMPSVEADAASLRRQREELLYWNAMRESHKEKRSEDEKMGRPRASTSASSFDDFLRQDENAEKGTLVFQTGRELENREGLTRRNVEHKRGLSLSVYADPFTDEHGIEEDIAFENSLMSPEHDELSDVYSATDVGAHDLAKTPAVESASEPASEDMAPTNPPFTEPQAYLSQLYAAPESPERELGADEFDTDELGADEYVTAGRESLDGSSSYGSIQAWAQGTSHNSSLYSPLPVSPASSATRFATDGDVTPADSASLVDVADMAPPSWASDVTSDDEGISTPVSWTEVGSVISMSEGEDGAVHA
ncbi:hypothetical protein GGR50DRAFT_662548 [Xylaria sp. CBS 124048]|nr:hypothetical protein GGR50DRAFT_662548 [Xylaria sp. CBS 124048]